MTYTEGLWQDKFRQLTFEFEGREAVLVLPSVEKNGHWMLKTEYFLAFPQMEEELLKRGWCLAYLRNINRWGLDEDQDAKARFRDLLAREFGLLPRCVPVGMSCGGLHAVKLAARHPDMVELLYLDAPVINFLSFPFELGGRNHAGDAKQECLDALNLTWDDMLVYREHPLDKIPDLIRNRVPLVLVWGDSDDLVPFVENGYYVKKAYEKTDIPALYQCKAGVGHHPHGPKDMEAAIRFMEENCGLI